MGKVICCNLSRYMLGYGLGFRLGLWVRLSAVTCLGIC